MSLRIDGNATPATTPLADTARPPAGAERGSFRGESVVALQQKSAGLSTSAMEEISMHFAEAAERTEFDEEKVEAPAWQSVMKAEEVMAYLRAAQSADSAEALVALAKRMLLAGQGNPGQLARQQFKEPTEQYLALQYALRLGSREAADPALLEAIRDAIADLEEDHGGQIRARLNTAAAVEGYGSAQDVRTLQEVYADTVLGQNTLAQTLQLALERFGAAGFAGGLKALINSLGLDLAAARPSTDPVRLQVLVTDLYQLEVIHTVLDKADQLGQTLARRHGVEPPASDRLVRDLVGLTSERWLSASRFTGLAQSYGIGDVTAQIGLLSGAKTLLRELPPRVFPDMEARGNLLTALQEALDTLIEQEGL
jgi:type III secretion protein W